MRSIFLFAFLPALLPAQAVSVGIIGGVPFTDAVNSYRSGQVFAVYKSTNFTVGPSLQVGLPLNLRFEVDALYRPSSFQLNFYGPSTNINANQWRFPFLLQYRLKPLAIIHPFVEAGASWDRLTNVSSAAQNLGNGSTGQLLQNSHGSFVLGAGAEAKVPFVRVSGELRYTRQGSEDFRGLGNLNQAEFLVAVHF